MKLEKLLNELIKIGWEPRGIDGQDINVCSYNKKGIISIGYMDWETPSKGEYEWEFKNLRELVSKESGLRQFCVENNLINKYADLGPDVEEVYIGKWKSGLDAVDINGNYIRLDDDYDEYHQDTDYKYWLIQSSLIDKDKLEKFLLENIKI